MKNKNILKSIILSIPILLVMSFNSKAMNLDPDIIENSTSEITVDLLSSYDEKAEGVAIRLLVENGEILKYQEPNGSMALGVCADSKSFESDKVCVDIVNDAGYEYLDNLGTITIKVATTGVTKISLEEGSEYVVVTGSSKKIKATGDIGKYSLGKIDDKGGLTINWETINFDNNTLEGENTVESSNAYIYFIVLSILIIGGSIVALIFILKNSPKNH